MRWITIFISTISIFLFITNSVLAQTEEIAVEVIGSANDMVGKRLIYQIKEDIRRSSIMRLSITDENRFQLYISTMPKFDDDPSIATIYSVIWCITGPEMGMSLYLYSSLGYCGRDVVASSAENIVAQTDELITNVAKIWNDLNSKNMLRNQ